MTEYEKLSLKANILIAQGIATMLAKPSEPDRAYTELVAKFQITVERLLERAVALEGE